MIMSPWFTLILINKLNKSLLILWALRYSGILSLTICSSELTVSSATMEVLSTHKLQSNNLISYQTCFKSHSVQEPSTEDLMLLALVLSLTIGQPSVDYNQQQLKCKLSRVFLNLKIMIKCRNLKSDQIQNFFFRFYIIVSFIYQIEWLPAL